ncbi:ANTAR domain-containing protein [Streptomyces sp. NPDC001530]|uniref:ANTAR domain-containing protein n=1 Tax=Streptomyces sp. NPDC001530 TaxID=3364582 RepID=UPI0036CFA32B
MNQDARSGSEEPPSGAPQESASEQSAAPAEEREQIVELREEIDQLKEAVTSHAVVDQAIGMMVALGRVTPDQGWTVLREVSQHTNIKLRTIAEMIIVWGQRGELPPDICAVLEDTLDKYGPTQIPDAPPAP